jgi:hypothetical protein
MFPGWHLSTLRRKPQTTAQKIACLKEQAQKKTLSQLGLCLALYLPSHLFNSTSNKSFSRNRLFSLENTFWGFFHQILSADGGCKEVVNQYRLLAEKNGLAKVSASTSAYCQARKKLDENLLEDIFKHTQAHLSDTKTHYPLINRRVIVVDGTGVSMADTAVNQHVWPQPLSQKIGCGFPQGRILALFDLHSGVALSYRLGNKKSHELPLLREQMNTFKKGDVFLGDKGFVSFFDMLYLKEKGVDSVIGLAKRKPITAVNAKTIISEDDLIVEWPKPKSGKTRHQLDEWATLPDALQVRQIKVHISQKGFRVKSFYIVTTLLDAQKYPADMIKKLYLSRWHVELYFRELKSTLGLDILRCKSPEMVRKEILMYFIVYNTLKLLAHDSCDKEVPPEAISFNECRQLLLSYVASFSGDNTSKKSHHSDKLIMLIKDCRLYKRFGRFEPRVRKRRPKPFGLMMKPRHEMRLDLMA